MASGFEQRHAVDHVLALGLQRRVAVLPGVAAVEEDGALAALGADRFQDGGDAVEAAEPAVGLRQRDEILIGQRIGLRRSGRDLVVIEQRAAGEVRHQALGVAGAEIDRGLAEIDRAKLRVQVGDVHQRHVAERLEAQQFGLRQPLLGQRLGPAGRQDRGGRGRQLDEVAT